MAEQGYRYCEICGDEVDGRLIHKHYVIPKAVMDSARIRRARIIRVCPSCGQELDNWYRAKIDRNVYDYQIKRFRERLPVEMVKEYQGAFNRFSKLKRPV